MRLSNKFHCFTGFGRGTLSPCNRWEGEQYLLDGSCEFCGKIGYCFGDDKRYGFGGTKAHDFENQLEYYVNLKLYEITHGKVLTREEIIDELWKESTEEGNEYEAAYAEKVLDANKNSIPNAMLFFGYEGTQDSELTMKILVLYSAIKLIEQIPYYIENCELPELFDVAPSITTYKLVRKRAIFEHTYRTKYDTKLYTMFRFNYPNGFYKPNEDK